MNRRINIIITDISNDKRYSISEYAELFNVSEQTIRNDLKEANDSLLANDKSQIIINPQGELTFENDEASASELLSLFHSFQTYKLSQNERRTILAMELLNATSYLTTYHLSDYVLVSRNTLLTDIDAVRDWFEDHNLELYSQTRRGYLVKGDENTIRSAMTKLLVLNGMTEESDPFEDELNIFRRLLLASVDKKGRYPELKTILSQCEAAEEVLLSEYSFSRVLSYLVVMVNRLENGKSLDDVNKTPIENNSKYSFANTICGRVSAKLQLEISHEEVKYLCKILCALSYLKDSGTKIDSMEIQILITEFVYQISKELNIQYHLNSDLFDLLINHMKLMINRLMDETMVANPLLEELEENTYIFSIVEKALEPVERYLNKKISKDESSFIVMYILAILENSLIGKTRVHAILVCNSGGGTVQLLKAKLKSIFPKLNVEAITSSHQLENMELDSIDLVVSTVYLKNSEKPYIHVHPIPTEEDIVNLHKIINTIEKDKRFKRINNPQKPLPIDEKAFFSQYESIINKYIDNNYKEDAIQELKDAFHHYMSEDLREVPGKKDMEKLYGLLSDSRISLDVEAENWQHAVQISGELMKRENMVTEEYIEAMIQIIEKDSYVVIYPGLAIPHAEKEKGALKTGASLVRLKEPVSFNHDLNDPVRYVLSFSITDGKAIAKSLYNLTEMLGTGEFIQELDKASTSKEMLQIMENFEKKVTGEL
ncbi:BglG family transcription antiterminator [Alkalibacter rhizosphaerae]|uniref:BglG family transcription antiterminator n=1 Tax=Alkalibacter rhizosphaerae TaxID=2815577 RepID=A0A974XGC1_9FIRM|nr:BglG family transcription antiterminator [Alkalibacter rhizosphaerae]QSX09251.1 BglG family transcription antiterminator [Alkalibacter rhizosphaerae]